MDLILQQRIKELRLQEFPYLKGCLVGDLYETEVIILPNGHLHICFGSDVIDDYNYKYSSVAHAVDRLYNGFVGMESKSRGDNFKL